MSHKRRTPCCEIEAYRYLSEHGFMEDPAAPEPDPIPDHYPHSDGYQRDCRRCVIDAAPQPETQHAAGCCGDPEPHRAPQPDTALTVERLARARATDGGWKEPNVTDRKWAEQFLAILRALGEGVES